MISHAINGRVPPVWLMGLSNLTLGLTTGIVFFVLPQLLAAVHVSEVKIAAITAVAMSPNFWAVVFSPMLLPKWWCGKRSLALFAASFVLEYCGTCEETRSAVLLTR